MIYARDDTIVAVSSPTSERRVIIRITGPDTIDKCRQIFNPAVPADKAGLKQGSIIVDAELRIDAKLYLFLAGHSYTGETLVEIHIHTNPGVTKALMSRLLGVGLRLAGPGEFTARAYLNGKIDLTQAEAVNEIITSSNRFQLAAAERLLAGRLAETTEEICSSIMDCLSQIEAGLDFSGEDIEFITGPEAIERLSEIKKRLGELLSDSIRYESVIDLPVVGIAGAPNAGKSSLLNRLLGKARSIVSDWRKTTRDVLTGELSLGHCRCVLFDCAGLGEPNNILDELAQQAAIEALQRALVVVFCVDISKADWAEDVAIGRLIEPKVMISVTTKSDLLSKDELAKRVSWLNELFAVDFLTTSVKTGAGIGLLRDRIDKKVIEQFANGTRACRNPTGAGKSQIAQGDRRLATSPAPTPCCRKTGVGARASDKPVGIDPPEGVLCITSWHRQAATEAIESISGSINELKAGNDEVAAMMLRAAYQSAGRLTAGILDTCGRAIQQRNSSPKESSRTAIGIDEQILENIFRRFCIGK